MSQRKYAWIRVDANAKKELDERLRKINEVDLKQIGIKKGEVRQIELTSFLFKNRIFISDSELRKLASLDLRRRRLC